MGKKERKEKSVCRAESIDKKEKSQKTNSRKKISDIAYQNKDIASKVFAEQLKGKSLNVYGVETGKIQAVLPTNLPSIRVNELRLDNLLELEDGTVALVDYESEYKRENKVKYLNYLTGIVNRYEREDGSCKGDHRAGVFIGN